MTILYLDCSSGISGDMTVAALLDLGADQGGLLKALASLNLAGYDLAISKVLKKGLEARDFKVILAGNGHCAPVQASVHGHNHDHGHHHGHDHDHGPQPPAASSNAGWRNIDHIFSIIGQSSLSVRAQGLAKAIFQIVAEAEAQAHGLPLNQVHFHEVGAVDSIVDIAAAAFCLDDLKVTETVVGVLSEGRGQTLCQHGWLPVPVPAVVNILAAHRLPVTITSASGEMITPTGAAIAAAIKTRDRLPEKFIIRKVGLGAGKKEFERPNILRAMLLEEVEDPPAVGGGRVWELETNLDDCTAEALAFTMERLFREGARDVFFVPIFMKKNRPAYLLKVICDQERVETMERLIFTHTTTIGLRKRYLERTALERELITVMTGWGPARVKKVIFNGQAGYHPEYESVGHICREYGQPFPVVYETVKRLAQGQ